MSSDTTSTRLTQLDDLLADIALCSNSLVAIIVKLGEVIPQRHS